MATKNRTVWTFVVTSAALFMALARQPRRDARRCRRSAPTCTPGWRACEWTVNAYTLTFAVLLLTGAALGDRFGRRRLLVTGLGTVHRGDRPRAALAPSHRPRSIAARAVQGVGGGDRRCR